MKNYARIEKNKVVEVFDLHAHFPESENIDGLFHSSLTWLEAPDDVKEGWLLYGGMIVPPDDLTVVLDRVDQAAGAARARYITVAPGQEATYIMKATDAAAYKSADYKGDVPPMVEAEANAVGCAPKEAADTIIAQQTAWGQMAAKIEQTRRSWKLTLAASTNRLHDCIEAEAELGAM